MRPPATTTAGAAKQRRVELAVGGRCCWFRQFGRQIRRVTICLMPRIDETPVPRRVAKPWGYEIWYALTDRYAGKILHVDRGHRLSLQYHERKDESCYLLTG